jgi:hypothetical protein
MTHIAQLMNLERLILIGGLLHFGILLASALVPRVLDWQRSLGTLDRLSRQVVWVHGAFIVLVIIGFGLLSVVFADQLAAGTPLARGVCLFIGLFWGARLVLQLFVMDAKMYLTRASLRVGYHFLTAVFAYHAVVYSLAAIQPGSPAVP